MADVDKVFAGSIPALYDKYLVPLIFETYAEDLSRRIAAISPTDVLETAAGSGVVARALAPKLADTARYLVTDLNQAMLDRAAEMQPEDPRIEWRAADAMALPAPDEAFDAVGCQFGAMFFPNRTSGYREARRVLRPGGVFVFNVWDMIEENEFADSVTRTAAGLYPEDPPRFLARTPHGYHDVALIEADVRAAGFRNVEIETIADVSRAAEPTIPAVAYCQGTPLRSELEARDPDGLEGVTRRAAEDLADRFGDGPVEGKIQAHVVTATK